MGDVIVKLNTRPVFSTDDVHSALTGDASLLLEILRRQNSLLFSIEPDLIMH